MKGEGRHTDRLAHDITEQAQPAHAHCEPWAFVTKIPKHQHNKSEEETSPPYHHTDADMEHVWYGESKFTLIIVLVRWDLKSAKIGAVPAGQPAAVGSPWTQ